MARRHSPPDEHSLRLAEFFREHHAKLVRFLIRRGASEPDARDVAQKAYIALLRPGVNFLSKRFPKAYLWTTAMREWARMNRQQQAEQKHSVTVAPETDEVQGEHPEYVDWNDPADNLIRNEDMARAYASLSREDKSVCNLLIEGLDAEEIVQATGLTRDQVERCITRVRKHLKGLS